MRHLTPDEFVDAAEGTLPVDRRRHVEQCDACRREASALATLMGEAGSEPVPEPSPLFWDHLSARVRLAVEAEGRPNRSSRAAALRWSAVAPLAGLAALVVVMVASVPGGGAPDAAREAGEAPSALIGPAEPASSSDQEWYALAELVGPLDWETAGAAGLTLAPGEADLELLDLSDDERRELSRLIAGELERAKS